MPDREDYVLKNGEFYYYKPESTSWCDILKNNVPLDRLCHEQILSDEMKESNHITDEIYETEREKWAELNARFLTNIPDYVHPDSQCWAAFNERYEAAERQSWAAFYERYLPILYQNYMYMDSHEVECGRWAAFNVRFLPNIPYEVQHGINLYKFHMEYGDTIPNHFFWAVDDYDEEQKKEVMIPIKSNKNHDEKEKSKKTESKKNRDERESKKDLVKKILERKNKRRNRSLRDRNERENKTNNQGIEDCDPSEYSNNINSNDYLNKRLPKRNKSSWRKGESFLEYYFPENIDCDSDNSDYLEPLYHYERIDCEMSDEHNYDNVYSESDSEYDDRDVGEEPWQVDLM